jgi:CDP-glycerol glycerophosphotransferase
MCKSKIKLWNKIKRYSGWFKMMLYRIPVLLISPFFHVRPKRIVFSTFDGKGFSDNSKYVALELLKRDKSLELIWLLSPDEKSNFPPEIKSVSNTLFSELRYLMTAGVWVDTHFKRHIFKKGLFKRSNQLYLQTWHGSLGIKNMPTVEESTASMYYPMLTDIKSVSYMISNSKFEDKKFKECFSTPEIQPPIKRIGHPRNDVFFRNNTDLIASLKSGYGLYKNVKIFTYMPTFRKKKDLSAYSLDFPRIIAALKQRFGGEWCIFVRLHPSLSLKFKGAFCNIHGVIDVTSYPDSQDLQIASDILCTDYSSCIYDFILSRRPGFIFASDFDDYNVTRGLCYPLTETPFAISKNNDELVDAICSFDEDEYVGKVNAFLEFHDCVDDGKASERVADIIEQFVKEKSENLL